MAAKFCAIVAEKEEKYYLRKGHFVDVAFFPIYFCVYLMHFFTKIIKGRFSLASKASFKKEK